MKTHIGGVKQPRNRYYSNLTEQELKLIMPKTPKLLPIKKLLDP